LPDIKPDADGRYWYQSTAVKGQPYEDVANDFYGLVCAALDGNVKGAIVYSSGRCGETA
jgi:hypothetical protein